jgi:putative addiction module CopG family antidote
MKVALGKELETVIQTQVASGLYVDASDAIRDAVRRTFCPPLDIEEDTPELAELVRQGLHSPSKPWKKGDSLRHLARLKRRLAR